MKPLQINHQWKFGLDLMAENFKRCGRKGEAAAGFGDCQVSAWLPAKSAAVEAYTYMQGTQLNQTEACEVATDIHLPIVFSQVHVHDINAL